MKAILFLVTVSIPLGLYLAIDAGALIEHDLIRKIVLYSLPALGVVLLLILAFKFLTREPRTWRDHEFHIEPARRTNHFIQD